MNFKKIFTRNGLLNIVSIAAPIVAGVVSGGVFTLPVLVTAIGVLVAKAAPSFREDAATYKANKAQNGQAVDDEDPR